MATTTTPWDDPQHDAIADVHRMISRMEAEYDRIAGLPLVWEGDYA